MSAVYHRLSCHCSLLMGACEHFYTIVQKIRSYFHSTRSLTHSMAWVSSIVVAWNWISRHHYALLNNSSYHQTLLAPMGNFLTCPTCKGDGGDCLLRGGRIRYALFFSLGIDRAALCFTNTTGSVSRRRDVRSKRLSVKGPSWVPEWPPPAQILFEMWNSEKLRREGLKLPWNLSLGPGSD